MSDKPKETRVMYLDDTTRVVFTNMNFVMEKFETVTNKKTKESTDKWMHCGFFGNTLKALFISYMKTKTLDEIEPSVAKLIETLDRVEETIKNVDVSQIKLEVLEEA